MFLNFWRMSSPTNTTSRPVFLNAAWRRLLLLNYRIQPEALLPWLPAHTELDLWNDTCYVSLVGFMFQNTRLRGFHIPGHVNFEEINLRFYVRRNDPELGWKRGVVFVREIVPRPAIAWVANTLYRERYVTRRMGHRWQENPNLLEVEYSWQEAGQTQSFGVRADPQPVELKAGSEAEFITEHYWGYSFRDARSSTEYQVEHPRWRVHPIREWSCHVDFGAVYGAGFACLTETQPLSVFLAEGSDVVVRGGKRILR